MKNVVPIIPKPLNFKVFESKFNLNNCKIISSLDTFKHLGENLSTKLFELFKMKSETLVNDLPIDKCIFLEMNLVKPQLGAEGYEVFINENMIRIVAFLPSGMFYGIQTLLQLIHHYGIELPTMDIYDKPRFKWRGMHLDVSRHFFGVEFIKKYLDMLAFYKINIFHWHLTDDNGWRIEIKKYLKLTEISAWRRNLEHIPWRKRKNSTEKGNGVYGGFYTQEEIKDIVEYAKQRFITVVPEIEMPGHTSEVFAAYSNLSCKNEKTEVQPGGYWPNSHIFCAGKDETFNFIENVLKEIISLFPDKYIHIGGDEADKSYWKKCPLCQKRIRDENLKDENELQTYFMQRISKFLAKYDKKAVGWDEIIDGGTTNDTVVMCWRGDGKESALKSIRNGNEVVMCPNPILYFDWKQSDKKNEKGAFGVTTIKKVYEYEPIPASLNEKQSSLILGAQGNVWTEFMNTEKDIEYMVLPRLLALSEIVWTNRSLKNWKDFCSILTEHYKIFDRFGWKYFRNDEL